MLRLGFKASFVKQLNKLPEELCEEALEKIELLKDQKNHPALRVHKLKGTLAGKYSFSINFQYRILFEYESTGVAILLAIGDHDVYK